MSAAYTTQNRTAVLQGIINVPLKTVISGYARGVNFSLGNMWPAACFGSNGGSSDNWRFPSRAGADAFTLNPAQITTFMLGNADTASLGQTNLQASFLGNKLAGVAGNFAGPGFQQGATQFALYSAPADPGVGWTRNDFPQIPILAHSNASPLAWQWGNAAFFGSYGVGRSYPHGFDWSVVFCDPATLVVNNFDPAVTGTPLAGFSFVGCIPAIASDGVDYFANNDGNTLWAVLATDYQTIATNYKLTWDNATIDNAMKAGGLAWASAISSAFGWLTYPGAALTIGGTTYTRYGILTSRGGLRYWIINAEPQDAAATTAWFTGDGSATLHIDPFGVFWFSAQNKSAGNIFASIGLFVPRVLPLNIPPTRLPVVMGLLK